MTAFLSVDIWKKDTNKMTSMPDYQIEISQSDLHTVSEGIEALVAIADALKIKGGN
jgi:hypothetical protein